MNRENRRKPAKKAGKETGCTHTCMHACMHRLTGTPEYRYTNREREDGLSNSGSSSARF